ncbi:hypothetical protein T439DRAFT_329724 [Meredithblackwellia eburnea MCA 4105]
MSSSAGLSPRSGHSSRRSSRSGQSSVDADGDEPNFNGGLSRTGSTSSHSHPSASSPSGSRRVSASASTPSTSPGSSGTFLTRFISNFRSSTSTSGSTARPSLPRSVSTPLVGRSSPSRSPGTPPPGIVTGLFDSAAPPSPSSPSSLAKRLRPNFQRRATTGNSAPSSPDKTPPVSADSPSASPRSVEVDNETDPMDGAPTGASGTRRGSMASVPMTKRGSMGSQRTVLPGGMGSPLSSPLTGRQRRPSQAPPLPLTLEQPLALVSSLLPTALMLLSFLGPTNIFNPPLNLPSLDSILSPPDTSPSKDRQKQFDQESISSTTSSLPPISGPINTPPTFTHELYAPSTISVPAVSAAAVWRVFRALEWISEAGVAKDDEPLAEEPEKVFDFPSLLQGVADVLAAEAATKRVELVIAQVGAGGAPSPVATPALSDDPASPAQKDTETRELLVRGDERKWTVVLTWILQSIIGKTESGATVEVHFLATLATPPLPPTESIQGSHDTILPTRQTTDKWWTISLEFLHTFDHHVGSESPQPVSPPAPPPDFDTSFAKSLFSFTTLKIGAGPSNSSSRSWIAEALLPGARPILAPLSNDPSSLLGRRRASLEGPGSEPSMNDLKLFAERGLKGTKVVLHAGERSAFAMQLTTSLAGWGMDVAHVPLERDESDAASTSGASGEAGWSKNRRELFGRFDSGFGGSPGGESSSPEPLNSPLKGVADYPPSPGSNHGGDLPSSVVVVDDDINTLRRLLYTLRTVPLASPPTILSKRPQLAARRTRSSPHVRQLHQVPPSSSGWVILHFASLSHYKMIKEIVQDALANSRSPSLPEVLVIPKPAGPRRIITALWTALKRPAVDPASPPIATCPTSPGVQYWTPRLSPALANQQDFESAAAESLGSRSVEPGTPAPRVRTPPLAFAAPSPTPHPPSPLSKISDEQASYFSEVAQHIDGVSPSEGVVIQSPNGRPAIFFQPQTGRARAQTVKEKGPSRVTERDRDAHEELTSVPEGTTTPSTGRKSVVPLHEIGLGPGRRSLSNPTVNTSPELPSQIPPDTPALTLDSFIAKSRGQSEEPSSELVASPTDVHAPVASRQASSSSAIPSRPTSRPGVNTSPRSGATSPFPTRNVPTPPISPRVDSPLQTPIHPPRRESSTSNPATTALPPQSRRTSGTGSGHSRKKRKATLPPTVPPIKVLIVEDNPINQKILTTFMKKKGIQYGTANDGEEAVKAWKEGSFHLVLMDIQLPVKDGIEATREIRDMERANNIGAFITTPTSDPSSPTSPVSSLSSPGSPLLSMPVIIVALTASSLQADRVSALAAGCNDFLTKPVSLLWLQQKLLEWGSMAYLSGFSKAANTPSTSSSAPSSDSMAASRPAFSAGLNARAKADAISAHLHIDPRPSSRSSSPARATTSEAPLHHPMPVPSHLGELSAAPHHPALTISSPSPTVTPEAVAPLIEASLLPSRIEDEAASPIPEAVLVESQAEPDLADLGSRLEEVQKEQAILRRPGPTPLSPPEPSLESIVREGARLVAVGRSRANSSATESFSQVMHHSGTVSDELLQRSTPETGPTGSDSI